MARIFKKMDTVAIPDARASILAPQTTPAFKASGSIDFGCGVCGVVLIEGQEGMAPMSAPVQLLMKCPDCGAHNRVPAQVGH